MYKNKNRHFWLFLALLVVAPIMNIHADGSRNWANPGSTPTPARRAFLRSSATATENWPFPNLGTHYVYAKAGEADYARFQFTGYRELTEITIRESNYMLPMEMKYH